MSAWSQVHAYIARPVSWSEELERAETVADAINRVIGELADTGAVEVIVVQSNDWDTTDHAVILHGELAEQPTWITDGAR